MVDGPWLQAENFAEHEHFVADGKILFHVRQIPPPAMQPRLSVIENQLEYRLGAFFEPFSACRDNLPAGYCGLLRAKFGDRAEMLTILIAIRPMEKQVLNRVDLKPRQLCGPFGANSEQRRDRAG